MDEICSTSENQPLALPKWAPHVNFNVGYEDCMDGARLLACLHMFLLKFHMSVRQYSLYNPVPWMNGGGPIAFAGFSAAEMKVSLWRVLATI